MWIRTLLTVGGVGVLGLGLLWSVGGLRLGVVRTVRVKLVVFVVVCYQFHSALCLEGKTKMVRKSPGHGGCVYKKDIDIFLQVNIDVFVLTIIKCFLVFVTVLHSYSSVNNTWLICAK